GATFGFTLKPVSIGRNPADGQEVMSCVVEHVAAPTPKRREPTAKNQAALLSGIREWVRSRGSPVVSTLDLVEIAKAQGMKQRNRLAEARQGLERLGHIVECTGGVRLAEDKL